MRFGISQESFNLIVHTLSLWPEIEKAAVFGSRAMGNYKRGSDVDIVLYGSNITTDIIDALSVMLNEKLPLPYYFDIIHYESVKNASLKEHIDIYGRLFYGPQEDKGTLPSSSRG